MLCLIKISSVARKALILYNRNAQVICTYWVVLFSHLTSCLHSFGQSHKWLYPISGTSIRPSVVFNALQP